MSKVKFGRMEPLLGGHTDGGSMIAYVDGAEVAEIVKNMESDALLSKDYRVTSYDVFIFSPYGDDTSDCTFWVAQLPIVRNGDSLKGLNARGYPSARAALKAAKDYVREVCK